MCGRTVSTIRGTDGAEPAADGVRDLFAAADGRDHRPEGAMIILPRLDSVLERHPRPNRKVSGDVGGLRNALPGGTWYGARYRWSALCRRQNPLELLDPVLHHDDRASVRLAELAFDHQEPSAIRRHVEHTPRKRCCVRRLKDRDRGTGTERRACGVDWHGHQVARAIHVEDLGRSGPTRDPCQKWSTPAIDHFRSAGTDAHRSRVDRIRSTDTPGSGRLATVRRCDRRRAFRSGVPGESRHLPPRPGCRSTQTVRRRRRCGAGPRTR